MLLGAKGAFSLWRPWEKLGEAALGLWALCLLSC